ncbi:MAG: class I SAM-dependent methyltransferase [Planctomycetaceae bacterium]|nr:class I SAM-dependent methyltransferase [Planctomycetaceae bacterium]
MTLFSLQFQCPNCHAELNQPLPELLCCERCQQEYPILGGIPRFVQQQHLASFGFQWNRYDVAHLEEDQATFEAKTGFRLSELSGLKILDAGCGGGRYSKIVGEAGGSVLGADQSQAVDKASSLCRDLENVRFIQSDLKNLPLPEASFDFALSIGVMHHDKDTRAVFDSVARMVKPGGRLAVWLYRRNQWWQEGINRFLRHLTTKMSSRNLERLAKTGAFLGGIPIVNRTLNKIVNFSSHPNYENRVCDTYDWYAPQYQHHHTVEELCEWFTEAGYEKLIVLPPEKIGRLYRWSYRHNLLIGSGVNVQGTRRTTTFS